MAIAVETDYEAIIRDRLRSFEAELGIPQIEHARRLNLPQSTLSRFLAGQYALTAKVARAVAAIHPELRLSRGPVGDRT